MARSLLLLFGGVAYLLFLATFLYLIGFVADATPLPRAIDHPPGTLPTGPAFLLDMALILLFALQHSVMARAGFKAAWTRIVPPAIERSCFVLFACLALILLFALWAPIPATFWDVRGTAAAPLLWAIFGAGWLIVLLSSFLINHFELFGLQQVWNHLRAAPGSAPRFRQPLLYRLVRHPLYCGFFLAFWATPRMSYGHLLFAGGMSLYMLAAIEWEERDLLRLFGPDYAAYRERVGKLVPRLRRTS